LILKQLTEGTCVNKLVFEFPDEWEALKYDEEGGFYKQFVIKCQGSKAVDFLVLGQNHQLWIEVKNFRNYAEDNRLRLDLNEDNVPGLTATKNHVKQSRWQQQVAISRKQPFIADEIAQKVRDTCAGVFGATIKEVVELQAFSTALQENIPVHVVLFLQQDEELDSSKDFRRMAQRIADKIKQQLVFINATVEVINQYTVSEHAKWRVLGSNL
jgi:hypothetical protein